MPVRLALLVAVLAMLSSCGDSDSESASAPTETVTVTTPTAPEPEQTTPSEDESTEQPQEESDNSGQSGDCIELPDVEGEDHQLAQDTMQAAGFYNLTEEDATGQGRALVLDRNWTVVSQEPSAGKCVSADRTIILRAEKDFE